MGEDSDSDLDDFIENDMGEDDDHGEGGSERKKKKKKRGGGGQMGADFDHAVRDLSPDPAHAAALIQGSTFGACEETLCSLDADPAVGFDPPTLITLLARRLPFSARISI